MLTIEESKQILSELGFVESTHDNYESSAKNFKMNGTRQFQPFKQNFNTLSEFKGNKKYYYIVHTSHGFEIRVWQVLN